MTGRWEGVGDGERADPYFVNAVQRTAEDMKINSHMIWGRLLIGS